MTFSQRLAQAAVRVEARLASVLEEAAAGGAPPRLVEAMRLATLSGGKRLRPFLVLECAGLFGIAPESALETAAALECLHCYSLVHDDLPEMDNDDVRRGKPTVHRAFDEWTAILAGDALLTLAFELLADPRAHKDASVRASLVAGLARASGAIGMVGGQCLDLEPDKLRLPPKPDLAYVERLQAMKTGALIRFACEAGAMLGHADPDRRHDISRYGDRLGAAFQVADDLIDAEGDAATAGKATGKDRFKATLVSVSGVGEARARLAQLSSEALAALAAFGPEADTLRDTVAFVARRTS